VWETTDPDGRVVVLTDERWLHVLHQHPDLDLRPETVLNTVARPSARSTGHRTNEE
jgi:hypothetical protein